MKYLKIITSIILTIVLTFGVVVMDPIEVMATLPNVPGSGTTFVPLPLISLYETLRDGINDGGSPLDFIKEAIKNSGFLSPEIPALEDLTSLNQYIGRKEPTLQGDTPEETAQNVGNYLINNVSVSDNSISFNDNSKSFTQNIIDDYVSNNKSYVYTYSLQDVSVRFQSVLAYNKWIEKMDSDFSESNRYLFLYIKNINYIGVWDLNNYPYLAVYNNQSGTLTNPIKIIPFNGETNSNLGNFEKRYKFNGSDWVEDGNQFNSANPTYCLNNYDSTANFVSSNDQTMFMKNRVALRYFNSRNDINVQSILYQPYYYNTTTWNDFSSSSGDYTFTPTNINTVSYGDTTTYIDSFNREEGYPPSIPEINNYINQQNEQNINNGNGSGGNGSGGNGSGDGNSNIFDWLKDLGSVLGNLIKGLGEFLTEIVSGLVSAITSLLESLSGLVTGVLESLTNIFSGLITFLYDGLPSEVKSVLTLGLTVALLITVIKLIRGN